MKKNVFQLISCVLLLAGVMSAAQKSPNDPKQSRPDPCALLTGADIQAVQGDAVQDTKPSTQPAGGLVMSQCLFRTASSSKSVSIAIATSGTTSPRAFWQKQFHSGKPEPEEKEKDKAAAGRQGAKEAEAESTQPRTTKGVGDQAYWVGSPMVGALYVLKGNTFLRISVGGVREQAARIQKSIALARLALKRLKS
ncbi:MAG: hypothetical protein LAO76_07510 [Acidobacteriia bacterium]|nr:hypothetical protein [Terriglobia bacterium]